MYLPVTGVTELSSARPPICYTVPKEMVTFGDIQAARGRIATHIHHTPLIHSRSFSALTGAEVHVKAENLQKTGSFKVQGARVIPLCPTVRRPGKSYLLIGNVLWLPLRGIIIRLQCLHDLVDACPGVVEGDD